MTDCEQTHNFRSLAMPTDTCYDFPLLKDEVNVIVQDAVRSVLEGNVYENTKVIQRCVGRLLALE